jgi:hypothetical protein
MTGTGVEKDRNIAEEQFLKAAEGGFKEAQFILGVLLMQTDWAQSQKWLLRSDSKGCSGAAGLLGMKYLQKSSGVPESVAYSWIRRGAEGGDAASQINIAGYLIRTNKKVEAYAWLKLIASEHKSDPMSTIMTAASIRKVESELDVLSLQNARKLSDIYTQKYSRSTYPFCSQSTPDIAKPLQYEKSIYSIAKELDKHSTEPYYVD